MNCNVQTFEVFAASAKGLLAAPINPDGSAASIDNVASIRYESFDEATDEKVAFATLAIGDVLLATPESVATDHGTFDFTFRWAAPGACWPLAGRLYRVQVWITPIGGLPYLIAWQANTLKVFT